MCNTKTFVLNFFTEKLNAAHSKANHFRFSCQRDDHRIACKSWRTIAVSIIFLSLLSGCKPDATKDGLQTISTPTLLPSQPSSSLVSTQNVAQIDVSKDREWKVYDINAIAWSMDSSMFAIAGRENSADSNFGVYAYDINSSAKLWFSETYVPFSLAYSPDNQIIAVPYFAGFSSLDAVTGAGNKSTLYQEGECFGDQQIAFSPDGTKIITLSTVPQYRTTMIYMWDIKADRCFGMLAEEQGVAFHFSLSRDGHLLALGLRDIGNNLEQQVHVWDTEQKKLICSFAGTQPISLTLDGNMIAAGSIDKPGDVGFWDAKTCQPLDVLHLQEANGPFSMDFSPDGKLLAIGGTNTMQIWDAANRKLLFKSEKLPNIVKILTFSPSGQLLLSETDRVSVNDKATITLWKIAQKQ